jgi:hypothetical protein
MHGKVQPRCLRAGHRQAAVGAVGAALLEDGWSVAWAARGMPRRQGSKEYDHTGSRRPMVPPPVGVRSGLVSGGVANRYIYLQGTFSTAISRGKTSRRMVSYDF